MNHIDGKLNEKLNIRLWKKFFFVWATYTKRDGKIFWKIKLSKRFLFITPDHSPDRTGCTENEPTHSPPGGAMIEKMTHAVGFKI